MSRRILLNFIFSVEKEIDGIGMGVLDSGIPYLTGTGLSIMCGVVRSTVQDITNNWNIEKNGLIKYIITKFYILIVI